MYLYDGPLTGNVTGDVTVRVTGKYRYYRCCNVTGNLTGNVTGDLEHTAANGGLTGTPNITVGSVSASSGTFSGNVSVGGTLTYQDVTNMDVLGIGTFQQGIQVLANGVDVTGIGTFEDRITYDGSLEQAGGGTVTYAVTVASKAPHTDIMDKVVEMLMSLITYKHQLLL